MSPHRRYGRLLALLFLVAAASAAPNTPAEPRIDHVLLLKKKHQLLLMDGDHVVKKYRVALGRGGLGPKRRQGDGRTPEGLYRIDWRNPASRFHLSLHISYPQQTDLDRARRRGLDPGGDIMIHGLGPRFADIGSYHRVTDWTDGCVAVTDSEMDEIWNLVPDGTPVRIRP